MITIDDLRTSDGYYPSFSEAEFARRHEAVRTIMRDRGLGAVVSYGSIGVHLEVQYLSNLAVPWEAVHVLPLEGEPLLFVQFNNHRPTAERVSNVDDVRRLGPDVAASVAPALVEMGLGRSRLGLAGRWPIQHHARLAQAVPAAELVDVTGDLAGLRLTKSEEELAYVRRAAELSDASILALTEHARPGMTEHELAAIIEGAYLGEGGKNLIHFVGVTPMEAPDLCVPAQLHSSRPLQVGDVVLTEISAQYHGYFGQTLRPFTVGAPPTPRYQELYDVAEAAYDRIASVLRAGVDVGEVRAAAGLIDERGLAVHDDVLHGANGNWTPIVRTPATEFEPVTGFRFVSGMTVVIQPNPITPDGSAGVQVGDMVQIIDDGIERLHTLPNEFLRIG